MVGRWGRAVASLLVGVCLLAGCTGDPEPKIDDPTPTPTSSATQSPTQAAMQAYRDFIAAYVEAVSTSLTTGDPQPWLDMSDAKCVNCKVLARNLRKGFAESGHIEGGRWTLQSLTFTEDSDLGSVWRIDVDHARELWFDGDGRQVQDVPAGTYHIELAVAGDEGAYSLREFRDLDA